MNHDCFEHTYGNGHIVRYRRLESGTCYHADTPETVIGLLEALRRSQRIVRVFLGDTETGRSWLEEQDCIGRIGLSLGPIKAPLLVEAGECGGPALLDHCILRIDSPRQGLYRHPDFHVGTVDVKQGRLKRLPWEVWIEGVVHARFPLKREAAEYVDFISGNRFSLRRGGR